MNMFYKQVVALNREQHKNLKLRQTNDCHFAKNMHLVPLAGVEFLQACRHYPIVFIGEGKDALPVALVGLAQNVNSFVDDNGQWNEDVYIPAFIRRYPFVLAEDQQENFTVCFDASYEGWNEQQGRELFTQDGQNTEFLNDMIDFLQNYTREMSRTRAFVEMLTDLQLLQVRNMQLQHRDGEAFSLSDFKAIDEEKLAALTDEQILQLHKTGFLGLIYAQLISLANANQLFSRFLREKNGAQASTETETTAETANKADS